MKTKIVAILVAVLSLALGGCVTTGVRTSTTVYTAPAHVHHHEPAFVSTTVYGPVHDDHRKGKVVERTTVSVVETTSTHTGAVVKKTVVIRKGKSVDCSDQNPYRDELSPRSPCYWKKHVH